MTTPTAISVMPTVAPVGKCRDSGKGDPSGQGAAQDFAALVAGLIAGVLGGQTAGDGAKDATAGDTSDAPGDAGAARLQRGVPVANGHFRQDFVG